MKVKYLALSVALVCACRAHEEAADKVAEVSAAVDTAQVDKGDVEETVASYGTVEFAADRTRTISFVKPGQVASVHVVAGQVVRKGDTLLSVGGVPRGAPEVQHAQVEVEFARRQLSRVRRLIDEKLATNQDLQQAEQQLAGAETALSSLGAAGTGALSLQAPTDGIVAEVLVQAGAQVQQGQPGVTLASRNALSVHVGFEVEDMALLQSGQLVLLSPVFAKDAVAPLRAQLSTLHRVVDPKTQLVEALIAVPEPAAWMASGLAVRALVIVNGAHDAVRVPLAALLEKDGKPGVFVVERGHAHFRELMLGVVGSAFREVKQGLSPGDAVVTVGQSTLAEGMLVRATEAQPR